MDVVSTVLSLLGVAVFILCTVSVAAAVTWTVVRISPAKTPKPKSPASS
jgi:hypothetical protein